MSSSSVQFYGLDNVLQAYSNNEVPRFALFAGKVMLLKYDGWSGDEYSEPTMSEGVQFLNNYLSSMYSGTTAIYTLKVYEDLEKKKKITPTTEYSTAFNFKLGEAQGAPMGALVRQPYGVMAELQKTNERIDKLIEAMSDDDEDTVDEPEEKKSFIATITGGLIADNNEVKELIDLCKSIFPSMQQQQPIAQTPAVMGNITAPGERTTVQKVSDISSDDDTGSERMNRIKKAVETLEQLDPNFIDNLEILAKVAKRDPAQFKQFLMILKSLE